MPAAGSKPNILVILLDDCPWHLVDATITPEIWTEFAVGGVRFTRGYAAISECGPARVSALKSQYPHRHLCQDNQTHQPFYDQGHHADTIATRLKAAGYATCLVGKYMNGYENYQRTFLPPGWDRWRAQYIASTPVGEPYEICTGTAPSATCTPSFVTPNGTTNNETVWAGTRVKNWITDREAADPTPWFCWFAPSAPHGPYDPTDAHENDYNASPARDVPSINVEIKNAPAIMRNLPLADATQRQNFYEGKREEMRDVSQQVGEVCALLRTTAEWANTVVLLLADNGYPLGEHRLMGPVDKQTPYEEASRVPFMASGGALAPAAVGQVYPHYVSQIDVLPTACELAGADINSPNAADGRSLLPFLNGNLPASGAWRRHLLVEHPDRDWRMLCKRQAAGEIRYVERTDTGERELYNLDDDGYQMVSNHGHAEYEPTIAALARRTAALAAAQGDAVRAAEVA